MVRVSKWFAEPETPSLHAEPTEHDGSINLSIIMETD
jgi:hypothetical protein